MSSINKICFNCNSVYTVPYKQRNSKYCSHPCFTKSRTYDLEEEINNYTVDESGCYIYNGTLTTRGYARAGEWRLARYILKLSKKDTKIMALHTCDTPPCIKQEHIYKGTHQDNVDDKVKRYRQPFGAVHGRANISEIQAQEILKYKNKGFYPTYISWKLSISFSTVCAVYYRKTWKHLEAVILV